MKLNTALTALLLCSQPSALAPGHSLKWMPEAQAADRRPVTAGACAPLAEWQRYLSELRGKMSQTRSIAERTALLKTEGELREKTAFAVATDLSNENFSYAQLLGCIHSVPTHRNSNFLATLQADLFARATEDLSRIRTPSARKMTAKLTSLFDHGSLPLFRFIDDTAPAPTDKRGGYSSISNDLFLNPNLLQGREFSLVITHELLHWMDPTLIEAAQAISDPVRIARISEFASNHPRLAELDEQQTALVMNFVKTGLDRGLWAEVRAWIPAFEIYVAARDQGIWKKVRWMEEVLETAQTHELLPETVFRYLIEHAQDPKEELYARPLLQEAYFRLKSSREAFGPEILRAATPVN